MNNRKLVSVIAAAMILFGYGVGIARAQSDASVMNTRKSIEQGKIPFTVQEFNFYAAATFCPVGCDFVVSNPAFPQKIVALQGSTLLPGNQITPAKLDSVFRPIYFNSYCSSELPKRGISFAVNVKDNAGGYFPWVLDSSVCPPPAQTPTPTPTSTPITGVNLALGKSATQSSNYNATEGLASKAVDGNTDGRWGSGSVTHTAVQGTSNPWWKVELGAVYDINKIQIWNRTDCCQERLSNFRIMVLNSSGNGWEEFTPGLKTYTPGEAYPLTFNGSKRTRGVLVQIMGPSATLMLAEVKVFGPQGGPVDSSPPTSGVNVALGKPATQSSNYKATEGLASNAVDGNTDGRWDSGSVTKTAGQGGTSNPYWQVDLGADYDVNKIQIWNRTDCCSQELTNFKIWTKTATGNWDVFYPGLKTYTPGETYPLTFIGNKQARYVHVKIDGPSANLMLAEVKVFGTPAGPVATSTPAPTPTTAPTPATGDGKAVSSEEEQLWAEVEKVGTVKAYQKYLTEYKNGKYAKTAQTRIDLSSDASAKPDTTPTNVNTAKTDEDGFWEEVEKNDSVIAYQAYIDKYPLGKYVGKALLRKQLKSGISATPTPAPIATPTPLPKVSADDELWNKIKDSSRVADFEVYLQVFPNGDHKGDAMLNISRLRPEKKEPEKKPEPEKPIMCTVNAEANLRDDSKKKILGILKRGRVVVSIEQSEDGAWERVGEIRNGIIIVLGWVSSKLLTCEGDEP